MQFDHKTKMTNIKLRVKFFELCRERKKECTFLSVFKHIYGKALKSTNETEKAVNLDEKGKIGKFK
jgi:hypothetical protein